MTMNSTTLAIGTSAGTLAASIVSSFILGALALYGLLHHREVFAWMKQIRKTDAENTVYDEPDQWLADLYKAQCRRAQKPSSTEDMEDISQTRNMIRGVADRIEAIRPDLAKLVTDPFDGQPMYGTEPRWIGSINARTLAPSTPGPQPTHGALARPTSWSSARRRDASAASPSPGAVTSPQAN